MIRKLYHWARAHHLLPEVLHQLLVSTRNIRQTLSNSEDLITEVNLVRMALGELRNEMSEKDRTIQALRDDLQQATRTQSERVVLFTQWADAAREGRSQRLEP